ncbi:MAG TPA: palindromic element RPE4 domain-containing protein [Rickettsia endosymbiont of Bembidion nr. Transversale]|nr:palindromic element RPE4 domain-containing protein [Rickettsia endosymbiont of Bembidion nr. Transversale]
MLSRFILDLVPKPRDDNIIDWIPAFAGMT